MRSDITTNAYPPVSPATGLKTVDVSVSRSVTLAPSLAFDLITDQLTQEAVQRGGA